MKKRLLAILAAVFLTFGEIGFANAELITNGDFETGDLTGWDGTGAFIADWAPHLGAYFAAFGVAGKDGTISQTLSTVIGQEYHVSFWFASVMSHLNS